MYYCYQICKTKNNIYSKRKQESTASNKNTFINYQKQKAKSVSFNLNPEIVYFNEYGFLNLEKERY